MTVALLGLLLQADVTRVESDGAVVFEAESAAAAADWRAETALAGFTGASYYTWRGGDLFGAPGKGVLRFRFRVGRGGTWRLRLRNRHDFADSTLENDCFTRLDDGPWTKTYSSERGRWTWNTNHESEAGKGPARYELEAGEHVLEISGRSKNFSIDRVALIREGEERALDPARPPSPTLLEAMAGPGPYRRLAALASRLRSGRGLGEARKEADRRRGAADLEEAREAETLHDHLTRYGESLLAEAAALDPAAAVRRLEEAESLFAGDDLAARAKEARESLKRDPKTQEELKADALWLRLQEGIRRLRPFAGSRDPKSEGFRRLNAAALEALQAQARLIAQRHPDTAAARRAEDFARLYR